MKKLLLVLCIASGLYACATKEDLAPELGPAPKKDVPVIPVQSLKDSPTCIIPDQDYVTISTVQPLYFDHGILGDLDLKGAYPRIDFDENYARIRDYYGNGNLVISFGLGNAPQTGIYYTNSRGYDNTDFDNKKYVELYVEDWNSVYPRARVKPNQPVLVVVSSDKTKARIKFCEAKLDLMNNNTGDITGEIIVHLD